MPHEIHVSERRSFRGCRRRWDWAYRDGFVPDSPIKALEFGIAYHKAMETFYSPEWWDRSSETDKTTNALHAFADECQQQKERYLNAHQITYLPEEMHMDFMERLELGEGMLRYYGKYVHPKYDNWFKPVAVEIPFEVPIEDPDDPSSELHCINSPYCGQGHSNDPANADSRVVYAGRVDMLVEDIRYGGYFIWDHKTAAALAPNDDFLQLDDQIGSYCWALSAILKLDIRGFIYAESRKDFPREPKALKRRMGGRSFSTAATQPTSIEIFEPFVKKHDRLAFDEGAYADYLNFLDSAEATQFSQRFVVIKSESEMMNIGKNIALEAADMIAPKLRIYPSVGRYTCSSCAFRQPCIGEFQGEDTKNQLETNYIQTNRRYWMEKPANSDKGGK